MQPHAHQPCSRTHTSHAAARTRTQVLGILSDIFEEFDRLCEENDVDKIKTIGDAYIVCAGALNELRADDAARVVRMGLAMQAQPPSLVTPLPRNLRRPRDCLPPPLPPHSQPCPCHLSSHPPSPPPSFQLLPHPPSPPSPSSPSPAREAGGGDRRA